VRNRRNRHSLGDEGRRLAEGFLEPIMISVERLETLAGVDRVEWDRLAATDVFASYGWLRTVEETLLTTYRPVYFVARGPAGFVAAAPCYVQDVAPAVAGIDRIVFGRFAKAARTLRIHLAPALICGPRTGLSTHLLVDPGLPPEERQRLTELLCEAMEGFARANGATMCFRNVVDRATSLPELLRRRGYLPAVEMPATVMDVPWTSFAAYVRDLKQHHRATANNISRERNRARKNGIVFRKLVDAVDYAPRLHALLDSHNRRLNGTPFPFATSFLLRLKHHLSDQVAFYVAFEGEEPIAVVLGIRAGESISFPMVGVDTTRREAFVYFNNSYNEPIEDAIATGIRKIYCGKLVYDVKIRRGFRLLPMSIYIHAPKRLRAMVLRPIFAAQAARMRRILAGLPTAGAAEETQ